MAGYENFGDVSQLRVFVDNVINVLKLFAKVITQPRKLFDALGWKKN